MGTNTEVAQLFREIADLLDLAGERFKPEAYRRAARSLENLPEDLRVIAKRGEIDTIPGIGDALAEKIREYLETGSIPYLARLQAQFPPGLLELTRLEGLGPKTARRFWVELGIEGPKELADALAAGRLNGVKGFGPRKIELIGKALAAATTPGRRRTMAEADRIARTIVASLRARAPLDALELAGSYRRCRETVGDLDVLATSREPEKVLDAFTTLPGLARQLMRGPTKATIVLDNGLQVDLRVVAPEEFGAALQYFTGSKEHNVHLRTIAKARELRINEYGVYRGEERIAGATEEEVYATLQLPWIPPEIREDHGEIEAAQQGRVPKLVEVGDLRGDLHVHLAADATASAVRSAIAGGEALGWAYLGFVVPANAGGAEKLAEVIRSVPSAHLRVLQGVEGTPTQLDRIGTEAYDYSIVTGPPDAEGAPKRGRPAKGSSSRPRLLAHAPSPSRLPSGTALVVGPDSPTHGVDSTVLRQLAESGSPIALSAESRDGGGLDQLRLAVGLARRGWTTAATVINARPWAARP
jgi:DNA polymerase (family 10)